MGASAKRSRAWRALAILAAGLLLAGCASVRRLDSSADLPALEKNEGVLVVHIDTNVALSSVVTSAGTVATDLSVGDHVFFVAVKSGTYSWTKVSRKIASNEFIWRLDVPYESRTFDVEPGAINYPGMLVVRRGPTASAYEFAYRSDLRLGARILNRSAKTLLDLEREHPSWLAALPVRYTGLARDDFLTRYYEIRDQASRADQATEAAE